MDAAKLRDTLVSLGVDQAKLAIAAYDTTRLQALATETIRAQLDRLPLPPGASSAAIGLATKYAGELKNLDPNALSNVTMSDVKQMASTAVEQMPAVAQMGAQMGIEALSKMYPEMYALLSSVAAGTYARPPTLATLFALKRVSLMCGSDMSKLFDVILQLAEGNISPLARFLREGKEAFVQKGGLSNSGALAALPPQAKAMLDNATSFFRDIPDAVILLLNVMAAWQNRQSAPQVLVEELQRFSGTVLKLPKPISDTVIAFCVGSDDLVDRMADLTEFKGACSVFDGCVSSVITDLLLVLFVVFCSQRILASVGRHFAR
jgi:hypothetical protein